MQEQVIARLREAVEARINRKMQTAKDFDFLADSIYQQFHEHISPTTLKRMWGYISEPVTPRLSTLNLLAQFVGADSWSAFSASLLSDTSSTLDPSIDPVGQSTLEESSAAREALPSPAKKPFITLLSSLFILLAVALLAAIFLLRTCKTTPAVDDRYIIHLGQTFNSFDEYLQLFGAKTDDRPWAVLLPGYPNLVAWGPKFRHPEWHNDGNPDSLCPSITEYWSSPDADSLAIRLRNTDHYTYERTRNEIRLTFMKDLFDSTFVFLGVYRMDMQRSNEEKIVWERVATECDVTHLDLLERFRDRHTIER